jgi:hypothetical protein
MAVMLFATTNSVQAEGQLLNSNFLLIEFVQMESVCCNSKGQIVAFVRIMLDLE